MAQKLPRWPARIRVASRLPKILCRMRIVPALTVREYMCEGELELAKTWIYLPPLRIYARDYVQNRESLVDKREVS